MKKRRFIAGAVCPECRQLDKLVTYEDAGENYRECVRCGFKEKLRFENVANEIQTRVNVSREERAGQEQVVKIVEVGDQSSGGGLTDPNRIA